MKSLEINLADGIKQLYPLPTKDSEILMSHFKKLEMPAKSVLVKSGQINDKMYFVSKGALRSYYTLNELEVTLWLGFEGDFINCFQSWISRKPGHENLQLVEDCVLYVIDYQDFQKLINENWEINNFYKKWLEWGYLYWEKRSTMLLFNSARNRLDDLLERNPLAMQRWPLGHIASYLGITQETLSRIRAEK